MKKLFLIFTLIIIQSAFSQQTDFLKIKKYRVNYLNDKIEETSGLNILNGKLYTFNDSGNPAELFEIDKKSGEIIRTLKTNLINTDWEALANDGENFYIGDFGNNTGTRKDLMIYKVPYERLDESNVIKIPGSERALDGTKIQFYYPEQTEFISKNIKNDFDAEAMIYLNGKLHIFTKEWVSKATSHYIVDPEISELQKAEKIETYKTGFVVTDASYFDKKLYLIGYTKKTEVFLDIFTETEPGIFFKEKPKHYYLGTALALGQIEGISADESGIYISGEKFRSPLGSTKPSFYFIPKDKLKD
ncbi:Uncharacterised protein [Chryseobacterium gleum]|uniref:Uncharacterized protein n=2 Tax=Chryseobacterium gleum TaxID=250 RepID=A0A3S5E2S5_CHRGE|nr:hypothetical protein [Chryseobacterium gleum]EFK33601.1 hypothetical protein HMPREF0204_12669 [Chryseobacterium gleum ATCC 35910]QQY34367.1 hypothetical protein I6I60_11595 [Chryseobacterium gleum]VEE06727.1 Uncharacterised protein [Chryseobacterium gleum]